MEDLDLIIDEALESYSAHTASPGLERRIMNQVQERPARFRWWPYALAAMILIGIMLPRPKPPQQPVRSVARAQAASKAVAIPVIMPVKPKRRHRSAVSPELALVAYLDKHPEEAAHLFPGNEPIVIEPISIPALPTGE